MFNPADLPNDIDALKALLWAREVEAVLKAQLNTRAVEIEHLKLQIAKLRRMQFGRKSGKARPPDRTTGVAAGRPAGRRGRGGARDASGRPGAAQEIGAPSLARSSAARRENVPAAAKPAPPAAVDCALGEDVAEQLEWIPAARVIRHVRPKLSCKCCDTIVQAPAPSRPIARGIAGPGLLAHVCWWPSLPTIVLRTQPP
jgi:hypothetical protein